MPRIPFRRAIHSTQSHVTLPVGRREPMGYRAGKAARRDREGVLATVDECRDALQRLAEKLAANADEVRGRVDLDRSLVCRVTDLEVAFHGRLTRGRLVDIGDGDDRNAKIKLTTTSDDLVALVDGELDFARALGARRVSISANPFDLLKLRKLL
jgi:hypothetical protein